MARSLNSKGREELASLKQRVHRQNALGRIDPWDAVQLIEKIDDLDAFIVQMNEKDQDGKEDIFSV